MRVYWKVQETEVVGGQPHQNKSRHRSWPPHKTCTASNNVATSPLDRLAWVCELEGPCGGPKRGGEWVRLGGEWVAGRWVSGFAHVVNLSCGKWRGEIPQCLQKYG